jgi:hypothetical protein
VYLDENGALAPWAPTRKKVGDLLEALAAICILLDDTDQPCWLDDRASSGSVIVAMANGLLDVDKRQLVAHTPLYLNQVAVPFDYDPDAPLARRWRDFLDELWPDEPEAQDLPPCRPYPRWQGRHRPLPRPPRAGLVGAILTHHRPCGKRATFSELSIKCLGPAFHDRPRPAPSSWRTDR